MDKVIIKQMRQASKLALEIDSNNGTIPLYNENKELYEAAGFTNQGVDVYVSQKIHAGLVGLRSDGAICIAFKGTEGILDWLNDAKAQKTTFEYGTGQVHRGFYDAMQSLSSSINSSVKKWHHNNVTIYLTGHSKGGAMATLMVQMLDKAMGFNAINVITFAAPRVGDKEFKIGYESYLKNHVGMHLRYEAFLDHVPHLPLTDDEKILLKRMGTVHEKISDFMKFIKLPSYFPVGERRLIEKNHGITNIPFENANKTSGESLNSFCAVEEAIRKKMSILIKKDIHNQDYDDFE